MVKSDLTNLNAHDRVATADTANATGPGSTGVKCNQSLQALFEAAHSELQNISKQDEGEASDAPVTKPDGDVVAPKSYDLTSALKSGQIMIIKCDSLDTIKTAIPQFPQGVTIVEKGPSESHSPLPLAVKFMATEGQSDHIYGSTSGHDISLKTNDDVSLGGTTYLAPRMPSDTIVAMNVIVPMPSVVGRKRKYPPKPGKHICPYCSRGCAKPSVLQKHIRAHTGERPYPCAECGFSFKTKSNLYKHCKSRSHSIKAGLVPVTTTTTRAVVDIAPKVDELEVTPVEIVEEAPVAEVRMKRVFVPKRCAKETEQKATGVTSNTVFVLQPGVNAVGINPVEMLTPSVSGTSGRVIGDCQYYDVTFMTAEGALQTISLPVHAVPVVTKTQATPVATPTMIHATTVATPTTSQVIVINNDATLAANLNPQVDGVGNVVKNIVVTSPIVSGCASSDAPMMPLLRQAPSTGRVKLTSSTSLSGYPMPQINQVTPRPSLTPEMLHERITQLISSNAAIVDTPMADAPRPKRVSRHNSMYEPMLVIDGPMTSATVLPPESARKTPKLTHAKSEASTFLVPVEHADQPPGSSSAGKSSVSASDGALTYTHTAYTMAPNEIKIQIRLPTTVTTTTSSVDVISPSIIRVGQSVGTPALTKVAAEHSVIKDLLLKGQPRSLPPTIEHPTSVVGEVRWVDGMQSVSCTACRQTFRDTSLLEGHLKLCPGGGGGTTKPCVTTAPEPVTVSTPAISCVVGSSTPSVKPQTVPTTTGLSPIQLEAVDPTVPPKRGRPKGSRNSYNSPVSKPFPVPDAALFPSYPSLAPRPPMEPPSSTIKPPNRPPRPVLRLKIPPPHGFFPSHLTMGSQSAGVSPCSASDLPTTPITSFAKMKLKGKILMKRSMSMERMLLQEKPMSAGVMTGLSLTSCLQSAPLLRQKFPVGLRRCESLDESMPLAKRARLQVCTLLHAANI